MVVEVVLSDLALIVRTAAKPRVFVSHAMPMTANHHNDTAVDPGNTIVPHSAKTVSHRVEEVTRLVVVMAKTHRAHREVMEEVGDTNSEVVVSSDVITINPVGVLPMEAIMAMQRRDINPEGLTKEIVVGIRMDSITMRRLGINLGQGIKGTLARLARDCKIWMISAGVNWLG
jgi:hypothetical protein